jgi:hypothetical protein
LVAKVAATATLARSTRGRSRSMVGTPRTYSLK